MKKILAILLVGLVFLPQSLFAANQSQGSGLTISPPIVELDLEAGKTYQESIKVNNPTQNLITVYPIARNFSAAGESGVPQIESPGQDATYGLATWITFSQAKLALTPQQEVNFKYSIKVPANAEPGGHYASVLFASEPPKPDASTTQVSLASMVGTLILGKVAGDITEKAEVKEFTVKHYFFLKSPIDINLKISNTGDVHFKPQGKIAIKNWGKTVSELDINPSRGNVLPNSTRKFENLTFSGSKWSFGKFTATLTANYGVSNQPLSGTLTFWIIPWWLIVIILIIAAVIVFLTKIIRKKGGSKRPFKGNSPKEPKSKHFVMR